MPVPTLSKIGLCDKEVQMALSMLDTIETMAVSIPVNFTNGTTKNAIAVLYAPGNTFDRNTVSYRLLGNNDGGIGGQNDATDISSENNASRRMGSTDTGSWNNPCPLVRTPTRCHLPTSRDPHPVSGGNVVCLLCCQC